MPPLWPSAVVVRPELLAGLGVVGVQPAARVGHEHQVAAGREQARERRLGEVDRPLHLAGDRVARVEVAVRLAAGRIREREVGADVELRLRLGDRRGLHDLEVHAPLVADLVVEAGLRVVGAGVPADAAVDRRAEVASACPPQVAPADQLAVLVDALDEVDVLDERPDVLDLGVGAVVDEDVAALVRMHDSTSCRRARSGRTRRPRCRSPRRRAAAPG